MTDAREDKDPTYIGAIRGAFGNPVKTLTTAAPIKDEVKAAFEAALRARGLTASSAPLSLAVTVNDLSANQLARRDAKAALTLSLMRQGGSTIYTDSVSIERKTGSMITLEAGVFASVEDLRALLVITLDEAIDIALEKPGFIAAVGSQARS